MTVHVNPILDGIAMNVDSYSFKITWAITTQFRNQLNAQKKHPQERMQDFEKYLRVFPFPKRLGISRGGYLSFIVEAYLQEIYIFKERMIRLSSTVEKNWRKTPRSKVVSELCSAVKRTVEASLVGPVRARGDHVHGSARFEDNRIRQLQTLEVSLRLFREPPPSTNLEQAYVGEMTALYKNAYLAAKRNWIRTVCANNEATEQVIEECFRLLRIVLLASDGKLANPHLTSG